MPSNKEKKQYFQSLFDQVSSVYDSNRFFAISADTIVQLSDLKKGMQVLDLSTGTGAVSIALAKKYPDTTMLAVDISSEMLAIARKKAILAGVDNIDFRQMDVDEIDLAKASFDLITCGYGMFFYPDMPKTIQCISDLLKPGGRLIFSAFCKEAFEPYSQLFFDRIRKYGVEDTRTLRDLLSTQEEIEQLCAHVNPSQIKLHKREIRYPIVVSDWWNLLNTGGYKGILNQLSEQSLSMFKNEHLQEVSICKGEMILCADTFYCELFR